MRIDFRSLSTLFLAMASARAQGGGSVGLNPKPKVHASVQACGLISDEVLKCPRFGFSYKLPYGWVDRTGDMQDEDGVQESAEHATKESTEAAKSTTLLAIFERPPGAPGETINSAVVIAAESLANYHGIKTAADYFGPITELAEQRGFKVVNEPHETAIGTRQLVRGDFSKERGKLTMWQSSLVMIEKGSIVSFTFLGGSEGEADELKARLSFGARTQEKQTQLR
jgi:hypothetical protein